MDMKGEYRIAAPRELVWNALNDPEILKQCIPGCESITKHSDTEMSATVRAKVGPVSARFGGKVTISDRDPPNGYKIVGEGTGGPAGFAKGGATVKLADDGAGGTILSYVVEANVGGKLAQIGSRLIDASARQMADNFFAKFAAVVAAEAAAAPAAPAAPTPVAPAPVPPAAAAPTTGTEPAPEPEPEPVRIAEMPPAPGTSVPEPPPMTRPARTTDAAPEGKRLSPAVWVAALAAAVIVVLYFFTR